MNDFATRLPPQDLDAERGVLGSLLLFNDLMDEVASLVTPSSFYVDANGKIYAAICRILERGGRADAVTVSDELSRAGELEAVGGDAYLVQVLQSVPHAAHAKYYAGIVRDKFTARSLIYACTEGLKEAYEGCLEPSDLLSKFETRISKLSESNHDQQGRWISEPAKVAMERHLAETPSGVGSGFADLDTRIGGLKPGRLIILAGRPGMGKTSLAENIIEHVAKHVGPVAFFSLEMPDNAVLDRMTISKLGTSLGGLRQFAKDNFDTTLNAIEDIAALPIYVNDSPSQTIASMASKCRVLQRQKGLALVIVDYLGLIEPEDRKAPKEAQIGLISQRLSQMAKSLQVPVICLSQLNRECEKRPDKRPIIADIRDSGQIEQNADVLAFLFRPAVYAPDDHDPSETELIVLKNRDGMTGIVPLSWNGESMTFRSVVEVETDFDPFIT